jgi:hypothetical protein
LAWELPAKHDCPLSRWSTSDLVQHVQQSGLVASISGSTLWRWLHEDAIRPWFHRSWIFPRDPEFADKAGRILDLYARQWRGRRLKDDEFVISADEKTSIQALPCAPNMSISAVALGPTSPRWTFITPGSSANAKPRTASSLSTDW